MKSLCILLVLVFFSCKTAKNTGSEATESKLEQSNIEGGIMERKHDPVKIKAFIGKKENLETSSVQILKSTLDGNTLTLKVGYSGGCTAHEFRVIGNQNISKSLPPIRSVELLHLTNGDTCREYIEKDLIIDLRELAYTKESGSRIKLQFSTLEKTIMYTYTAK
jgi:hypothetical protein